ncbi:MAG: hypothetical protein U9Q92_01020 [archaeon]|nr:hypothetical protein [archaeon]
MLKPARKGISVTVESILLIGGVIASALFFVSFYKLAIYQADNVFSASQEGFANDLKMKINSVYLSRQDVVEYSYHPPVKSYKLAIKDRILSIKYSSRQPIHILVPENINNANIENSNTICIRKTRGIIEVKGETCSSTCNLNDDTCDKGCMLFGKCDPACKDCEIDD